MSTSPTDRCPGALRPHRARDGYMVRLRFPGGRMSPEARTHLAAVATDHGDGELHLTSRGNVQIRGIDDPDVFARDAIARGLVPSAEHDTVRNILASPMAGRVPGRASVGDLPERLDAALLETREVAGLSGRFLFGFDDGSGDIEAHAPDLGAVVSTDADDAEILLAGRRTGRCAGFDDLPGLLTDLAVVALDADPEEWRVSPGGDRFAALESTLGSDSRLRDGRCVTTPAEPAEVPRVGWVDAADGSVSLLAVVAFGTVPARLAEFLGAIDRPMTISPDRVIGIHGLTEQMAEQVVRVLAPMGLIFDAESPWAAVTACVGSTGCEKSLTDVRRDAAEAVSEGRLPVAGPQHWVGCERGCGDTGRGARVTAGPGGYRVTPR